MKNPIQLTHKIPVLARKALSRFPLPRGFPLLVLTLALVALLPAPNAFGVSPPPDGGYPNQNTAEGTDALFSLTTGKNNTALGFDALYRDTFGSRNTAVGANAIYSNNGGHDNTAIGYSALLGGTNILTNLDRNTAVGAYALANNGNSKEGIEPDGDDNTANGAYSLYANTTGYGNTATGSYALYGNTEGAFNTATGLSCLRSNTTGSSNTASGAFALFTNTEGFGNTAFGMSALQQNTTASDNTAIGGGTLANNTTGANNTAEGFQALLNNTTGNFNTASGQGSLVGNTTGHNNTADGQNALKSNTTGSNNVAVGSNAGKNLTTGNNNINVSNPGVAGEANTIRIGKQGTQTSTFIAGISGVAVNGSQVVVNSNGKLGVAASSARFKNAIKPMDKASEAILALQPVTFRYKQELDSESIPQFGLVAEQVEKVDPDLVARDHEGKPYTVRYEAVNAMLLNEFLKEHRKVEQQAGEIARMRKQIEALSASVEKLTHRP